MKFNSPILAFFRLRRTHHVAYEREPEVRVEDSSVGQLVNPKAATGGFRLMANSLILLYSPKTSISLRHVLIARNDAIADISTLRQTCELTRELARRRAASER